MDFSVLTLVEVEQIHQASLHILSKTGLILTNPQGREILLQAGAKPLGERLLLPPNLVEDQIKRCPQQVRLIGRRGQILTLGDGQLHWHNLGGAREIYDSIADNRRPATVQDVKDSARLLDALPQVTAVTPFFTPTDVPGACMSVAMYRYSIANTSKPVHGPGVQNAAEVKAIAEMASVIGGGNETLSLGISPISPLFFPDSIVEAIIETARLGILLTPLPCPTAGATAPLSLAGALAQQNAEVLATVVLAQLVHPGLPVLYCGRLSVMDPRSGTSIWGGVELALISAATVQLAHRYGLPINVYGFSTNSMIPDLQNGYERAFNACLPALIGADELSGIGEMEAGVMGSYLQMVLDNEIVASIQRLKAGLKVNLDTLATDVIAEVMDGPRNFLGQMHTVRHLRSGEVLFAQFAERRSWMEWVNSGREDMVQRAQAETQRILNEHQAEPLTDAQEHTLDDILNSFVKEN